MNRPKLTLYFSVGKPGFANNGGRTKILAFATNSQGCATRSVEISRDDTHLVIELQIVDRLDKYVGSDFRNALERITHIENEPTR